MGRIDTQALGLIGLDVGLLAVAVAAQEALGPLWWTAVKTMRLLLAVGALVLTILYTTLLIAL